MKFLIYNGSEENYEIEGQGHEEVPKVSKLNGVKASEQGRQVGGVGLVE